MHVKPHGGPTQEYMKCSTCEEFHVNSPLVFTLRCKSVQKLCICDYEKRNDYKSAVMARWEALHFPPTGFVSTTCHARASTCG